MVTILKRTNWNISDEDARRVAFPHFIKSGTRFSVSYAILPAYKDGIVGLVQENLREATLIGQPQITPRDLDRVNLNMSFQVNSDWALPIEDLRVHGAHLMEVTIT